MTWLHFASMLCSILVRQKWNYCSLKKVMRHTKAANDGLNWYLGVIRVCSLEKSMHTNCMFINT